MKKFRLLKFHHRALMLGFVLLYPAIAGFAQSTVDAALRDLASADLKTRTNALYALVQPSQRNGTRVAVNNLLRANPAQSERIKTALISALEMQGAEHERLMKNDEQMSEAFLEYWLSLTEAVAVLRDPRAAHGLLMATMSGAPASVEGLADICPAVVDLIVRRAHEAEIYWQGSPLRVRAQAINVLGNCLRRPEANFTADAASKIRSELMAALDDPDWNVRAIAATALIPLRAEPEVRAKLQLLATTDPYVSPQERARDGSLLFNVRESAARALNPPKELMFYVTRAPESRACRVQQASVPLAGDPFIGPTNRQTARDSMCAHYDSTGQDPSLCWLTDPASPCVQGVK